jgi:hypothetical protein
MNYHLDPKSAIDFAGTCVSCHPGEKIGFGSLDGAPAVDGVGSGAELTANEPDSGDF